MFDHASASEVAKWVALVFAAGFIGFFGKFLARSIISLFQKKDKAPRAAKPSGKLPLPDGGLRSAVPHDPENTEDSQAKDRRKLEKKALKARQKAAKKQQKAQGSESGGSAT